MKTRGSRILLFLVSFYALVHFSFSTPGDTLKGIRSMVHLPQNFSESVDTVERELNFPQHFIYNGVKRHRITPFKPESDAWTEKIEFEKDRRDSFYLRKYEVEIYDDLGEPAGTKIQYAELSNFSAYRFYEEIVTDANATRIFVNVKGITLFYEDYQTTGMAELPLFYFDNSQTQNICQPDFVLLSNRKDTLQTRDFSEDQRKGFTGLLLTSFSLAKEEKARCFANGKQLTRKDCKKLFKQLSETPTSLKVYSYIADETWYFDPFNIQFQKEIKKMSFCDENGNPFYIFEYGM